MKRRLKSLTNIRAWRCDWCGRPACTIEPHGHSFTFLCALDQCHDAAVRERVDDKPMSRASNMRS